MRGEREGGRGERDGEGGMGRQCGGEVGKAIGHFVRLNVNPHFAKLALLGTRREHKGGIEVRSFRAARPYMCVYVYICICNG